MKTSILAGLAVAVTLAGASRAAQAVGPLPAPPAARSFRVGTLTVVALRDARVVARNDGKTFGIGVDPAQVALVLRRAGAPADEIYLDVGGLLVKEPGQLILIDTGLGPAFRGALAASLAQAGVTPAEITDVLITHPHADHVGGLVTATGSLAFPHATIRLSGAEWGWMRAHGDAALVRLIAPQVRTFVPGESVAPGVTAVGLTGHTPGHAGYEIVSGSDRLLDIGDTAHSAIISLARPAWTIEFDQDAAAGRASRIATLTRLARSHERVYAPHFPFPGVGRIEADGEGFAWKPDPN